MRRGRNARGQLGDVDPRGRNGRIELGAKGRKKKGRRTGSESVKPLVDKCSTYDPIIWSRMEEIEE